MFKYVFRANLSQRIALALFGSLLFGLLNLAPVMAQETEATQSDATEVSAEAQASVEADLTASADAAKESDVDIKEELDIAADYDPVVPNTFVNSIGYGFKKFGRGIKGASYRAFASTESSVELSKRYADLNLVEAIKLQSIDPTNSKVVGILNDYKSNLDDVKDRMEGLKQTNGQFAKEFSAKVAEDHLFTAPKILNSLQQNLLSTNPTAIPEFLKAKAGALANAGETVIKAAANSDEAAETLKSAAEKNFKTPFSGIGAADNLTQAKEQLVDVPEEFRQVFDKAISSTLNTFHDNFKALDIPDESKAEALQKYVEQLPGQSMSRLKVMEQFKNQADLPPAIIAKMNEVKARMAQVLSQQLDAIKEDYIRQSMGESILSFKDPNVEDINLIKQMQELVPSEQIRKQMSETHGRQVEQFLNKFGNDANAQKVTAEFQALTSKVQSGEVMPDASFFQTLDNLKSRLSPEQQKFIDGMHTTAKDQMQQRMQNDPSFAQRISSFNPGDVQYYDQLKQQFDPKLAAKFNQIEQAGADNFKTLLNFQNDPANIQQFQQRFETEVPEEFKQKMQKNYNFDFEQEFQKQHELAQQKSEFFHQKQQEFEQQFKEKFGDQFQPPGGQFNFGQPNFGFPGQFNNNNQGFQPVFTGTENAQACPPGTQATNYGCEVPFQQKQFDPSSSCSQGGGIWTGNFCSFPQNNQEQHNQQPGQPPSFQDPIAGCNAAGGTWTGFTCQMPQMDPVKGCANAGGSWMGNYCKFENQQNPPQPVPVNPENPQNSTASEGCSRAGGTWMGGYCKMPNEITQPQPTPIPTPINSCSSGQYWDGRACVNSSPTNVAGQKEQIWNSLGLRSWIRTDADPARIGLLKQACANVSSGFNIWMPGSGDSSSPDFGMPNPDKCKTSSETTQPQPYPTPSNSCPSGYKADSTGKCVSDGTIPTYPTPTGTASQEYCNSVGGTWMGTYCQMPNQTYPTPVTYPTPSYPTPSDSAISGCISVGGTWTGTYCQMPNQPAYPTPSTAYPTPSTTYPTPSYPTPSTTYPTPSYPTPSTTYPTPSYPTPDTSYPTPSTTYPTPSYQTPESYPTPSGGVQGISLKRQPTILDFLFGLLGLR